MAEKTLTLAVAAYNVGEYLAECINSAAAQREDFRMIIADDGSPDGSAAIADEAALRDARVVALHFKNSGVSVARNNALDLCETDYIWYIDGDDMAAEGSIVKLKTLMDGGEEAIMFSRAMFGGEIAPAGEDFVLSAQDILDLRYKNISEYPAPRLKRVAAMSIWAMVLSVPYMKANNVRFLPGLRKSQDVLFNALAFKNLKRARFHDEPFYIYRPNEGSVSMRYIKFAPESYVTLVEHLAAVLGGELKSNAMMRRMLCARAAWCVREALRSCFCHADNKAKYAERRREYFAYIKNTEIGEYFRGARLRDLTVIDKYTTILARARLFFVLNAGSKIVGRLMKRRMRSHKAVYRNA